MRTLIFVTGMTVLMGCTSVNHQLNSCSQKNACLRSWYQYTSAVADQQTEKREQPLLTTPQPPKIEGVWWMLNSGSNRRVQDRIFALW